jgi:hypothetical protein
MSFYMVSEQHGPDLAAAHASASRRPLERSISMISTRRHATVIGFVLIG